MNHPKAEAARKAVERMEQDRATGLKIHGVDVKPGQHWVHAESQARHVIRQVVCGTVYTTRDDHPQRFMWNCGDFADRFKPYIVDGAAEPAAPERWTDARYAEEQVALARRQAEVARAEARELAAQLAEARAALEAARAAVHTPSPGGSGAWTPPVLTPEQVRGHLAEGKAARAEVDRRLAKMERPPEHPDQRLVDGIVDAAIAARRGAPRVVAEGRDPATRTRALPVVPTVCETCEHEAGSYCHHPLQLCCEPVEPRKPPPVWCKVRSELAKAGVA